MNNFQLGFCFRRASCTVLPAVLIISPGGGGGSVLAVISLCGKPFIEWNGNLIDDYAKDGGPGEV